MKTIFALASLATVIDLLSATALALPLRGPVSGALRTSPRWSVATDTGIVATGADARCVTRPGAWARVPFKLVDLHAVFDQAAREGHLIYGPATRVVVEDSAEWPAVWKHATDPSFSPDTIWLPDGRDSVVAARVSAPLITFGRDAIVLVTTSVVSGTITLSISSIRRCRQSGTVVVTTIEDRPRSFDDDRKRSIIAARIPRRYLGFAPVVFASATPAAVEPPRAERPRRGRTTSDNRGAAGIPTWVYADSNLVEDTTVIAGRVAKHVIIVAFDGNVPISTRTAAIALVNGTIVGDFQADDEGGRVYYVRVSAETPAAILAAAHVVAKASGVGMAIPVMTDQVRPDQSKRKARRPR